MEPVGAAACPPKRSHLHEARILLKDLLCGLSIIHELKFTSIEREGLAKRAGLFQGVLGFRGFLLVKNLGVFAVLRVAVCRQSLIASDL